MTMHERIMAGKLFTDMCEGLPEERNEAKRRMFAFNATGCHRRSDAFNGRDTLSGQWTCLD